MAHGLFPFVQYMSVNGDGTGTVNMAGNYLATPQLFRVQSQPNQFMHITRLAISIADNAQFGLSEFGSRPALLNGIKVETKIHGNVIDSLDGFRIKQNQEWYALGNTHLNALDGPGRVLVCTIEFVPNFGTAIDLDVGDYLGIVINDDLSSLVEMLALCTGKFDPFPE